MGTPVRKSSTAEAFRALIQYSKLPRGHKTFQVSDDGSAPHLGEHEFAVIDTTDRKPQHGELYLIQYESGRRNRHIVLVRSSMSQITPPPSPKQQVWWACDLAGFRRVGDVSGKNGGIPTFTGLSDGPYLAAHLSAKLIGRVVGFAATALGDLLAPSLGYEDEALHNAAFDPAEYLDVLIATGHRPCVFQTSDGRWVYGEYMPERGNTDAEYEAIIAVRWKFVRASSAKHRVTDECVRRGLVEA